MKKRALLIRTGRHSNPINTGPYDYQSRPHLKVLSVYEPSDPHTQYLPDFDKEKSMAATQPKNVYEAPMDLIQ